MHETHAPTATSRTSDGKRTHQCMPPPPCYQHNLNLMKLACCPYPVCCALLVVVLPSACVKHSLCWLALSDLDCRSKMPQPGIVWHGTAPLVDFTVVR